METELWPNLIRTASARRIPVLLVNGRISERSYRGYRRIRFFVSDLLRSVSMCCMQNEIYAQRIRDLGAPQERVRVVGSLKFDTQPLKSVPEWTGILSGPVIVAGSTHRTEEDLILDAFVALRRDFPDLNVILAPRHPERFREVEELTRKRGLAYLKRSELDRTAVAGKEPKSGIVVILDAMGELSAVYGSCDVAVMGGSFISHGGQNPLEPAYWAKPIVCGPHMENFPFIAEFYRRGGAAEVDALELAAHLHALLSSPEKRTAMGNNARALCEENAGASGRTLDVIEEFLRRGNG
jgi:3-deoxy-D-manno-octulosonic-acid transferase